MIFYIDRLTAASCRRAIDLKRRMGKVSVVDLRVLDPLPSGRAAQRLIARLGGSFAVEEEPFVAGRLKMQDGQPVYIAARRRANDVAILQAAEIVRLSPFLTRLNSEWGRNTILLHLARHFGNEAAQWLLRRYVADTLFRQSGERDAVLILEEPDVILPSLYEDAATGLRIEHYRPSAARSLRQRVYPWLWLIRHRYRKFRWRMENLRVNEATRFDRGDGNPALLLLQEDDLLPDRSYRTQPHWLEPEDPPLPFRTFILQPEWNEMTPACAGMDPGSGIRNLPLRMWSLFEGTKQVQPLRKILHREKRACLARSFVGVANDIPALFPMVRLLDTATDLAAFCSETGVRAFMTSENYFTAADAMQIIAGPLGIRTLSNQYSNMSSVGPSMMTTADTMVTFSPIYHERWTHPIIAPKQFYDAGYLYDSAFKRVRERAKLHRQFLMKSGARFILCFFDENAFRGKYELVLREDLVEEIRMLLKLIVNDSSWGLVVKSQFQQHSPIRFPELSELRKTADATGRYLELTHGTVRNTVFPAEAALVSDMAFGHAVGATAALESALSGTRTILLNPYGIKSENDKFYEKADIVYSSIGAAMEAIGEYRAGKPERAGLGDWSPLLHEFDPFLDGGAAARLRAFLEKEMKYKPLHAPPRGSKPAADAHHGKHNQQA
jgi:hypothetical protein